MTDGNAHLTPETRETIRRLHNIQPGEWLTYASCTFLGGHPAGEQAYKLYQSGKVRLCQRLVRRNPSRYDYIAVGRSR